MEIKAVKFRKDGFYSQPFVMGGEDGKTCRDLGHFKKYSEKVANDPIWLTYNRAYKQHYARLLKKEDDAGGVSGVG